MHGCCTSATCLLPAKMHDLVSTAQVFEQAFKALQSPLAGSWELSPPAPSWDNCV